MTAAAFKASYSDWKLIKTRSVVQIIFEVPIEGADAAYQVLNGMPNFGAEEWFEISSLQPEAKEQEPAQASNPPVRARNDEGVEATRRAGYLCKDARFKKYLWDTFNEKCRSLVDDLEAARLVRVICEVESRTEFQTNYDALNRWRFLESSYHAWLLQ